MTHTQKRHHIRFGLNSILGMFEPFQILVGISVRGGGHKLVCDVMRDTQYIGSVSVII